MHTNEFQGYKLIPFKGKLKDIVGTSDLRHKDISIMENNKCKSVRIYYLVNDKHAFIPSHFYEHHKAEVDKLFQGVLDENLPILVNEREDDEIDPEKSPGNITDFSPEIQTLVQSDSPEIPCLMKVKDFSECPFEILNPGIIPDKQSFFFVFIIQKKVKSIDIDSISINLLKDKRLHYYFKGQSNIPSDGYFTFCAQFKYTKSYIEICLKEGNNSIYRVLYKANAHGNMALKFIKKYPYKQPETRESQGITLKNKPRKKKCYVYLREEEAVCKRCGDVNLSTKMIRCENKPRYYKTYFCRRCGIYYITLSKYLEHADEWKIINLEDIPEILEQANNKHEQSISAQDFVVKMSVLKCRKKNHPLEDLQATITAIDKNANIVKITVPGGYCPKCKTYFLLDSVYKRIKEKGIPVCRVMDEKSYTIDNSGSVPQSHYDKLASESVLRQFGYNVNQAENLSPLQRRRILAAIVDYKILSKSEIISYLDYFINVRKSQKNQDGTPKMNNAIKKWREDRDWVSAYKIGSFKEIQVKRIIEI